MDFNPLLDELALLEQMDVRSTNTCRKAGIKDLKSLLEHYRSRGSFTAIPNCGRKTDAQLQNICLKYVSPGSLSQANEVWLQNSGHNAWTAEEIAAIETFIRSKMTSLGRRAYNRMNLELQDLGLQRFMEKILNPGFNFLNVKHIGRSSLLELEDFRGVLRRELERMNKEKSSPDGS